MRALVLGLLIVVLAASSAVCEDPNLDPTGWLLRARSSLDSGLNSWDIDGMMAARAQFERLLTTGHEPALVHYYLAYADYRIAIYHILVEDKEQADLFLDDGLEHVGEAERLGPNFSDAPALRAALYGIKIAVSPMRRGFSLGPQSGKAIDRAYAIDDSNPRIYVVDGNRLFRTPGLFGGSKEKALERLRRAAELFEAEPGDTNSIEPYWGHAEVFAMIGQIHMAEEEFDEAEASYRRALQINPEYGWVKFRLMPALRKARRESE